MKYLMICLIVALMTGCSGTIDGGKIYLAEATCKDKGGVDYINLVLNIVYCNNGANSKLYRP